MKKALLILTVCMCLFACQKQEIKEETVPPVTEKEEVKPATVEVLTPEPEATEEPEPQPQEDSSAPQGMSIDEDASYEVEPDSDYIIN